MYLEYARDGEFDPTRRQPVSIKAFDKYNGAFGGAALNQKFVLKCRCEKRL